MKTITLADVDREARRIAPDWWNALSDEERLLIVDQYNQVQATQAARARQLDGPPRKSRKI
jgi:hypothetical protein